MIDRRNFLIGSGALGLVSACTPTAGAVTLVATATPGIKDLLVLAKVKQLERAQAARKAASLLRAGPSGVRELLAS